jgi:CHASE1-domain containing sensor protein
LAWFRQYILVFFVLGIGVAASVAGFRQFVLIEESEKRRSFVLAASDRLVAIERSIQSNLDSVLSVKSFFESNLVVHREQFRSFVSPMLKRNGALKALEWVPNVPAKDRDEFEAIAKSEGFSNFRFTERDKKGKLVSAGMRENYFPVFYVEPMKGNEGAFGFDLGSSVNRRNALELARDSGRLTTSESITLVQNRRKGVLLFAPIFQAGGPSHTIELRRKNIVGFALGVLEIQNMIAAAFSSRYHLQTPGGIDFFIFGEEKPGGTPPIYIHQGADPDNYLI